jgi:hypothetical protein
MLEFPDVEFEILTSSVKNHELYKYAVFKRTVASGHPAYTNGWVGWFFYHLSPMEHAALQKEIDRHQNSSLTIEQFTIRDTHTHYRITCESTVRAMLFATDKVGRLVEAAIEALPLRKCELAVNIQAFEQSGLIERLEQRNWLYLPSTVAGDDRAVISIEDCEELALLRLYEV